MDNQQLVALGIFVGVYALLCLRWVDRTLVAVVGAVAVGVVVPGGVPAGLVQLVLVTGALGVLGGFVKRSGLASWLALQAARAAEGRPRRILGLLGLLSFGLALVLGPGAMLLVLPVGLLLAVELEIPSLPFVVLLTWSGLLGGATTLTAFPGNLWLGSALGLNGTAWFLRMAPLTGVAWVVTFLGCLALFHGTLRVTHERRARVLEYDASRSITDRALWTKTSVVLGLVIVGLALAPLAAWDPGVVIVAGTTLLLLWDDHRALGSRLADVDLAGLIFYSGLWVVVGALGSTGLSALAAPGLPAHPLLALGASALAGAFIDHGALVGALAPTLKAAAWGASGWPWVVVGSVLGAGATAWGTLTTTAALGLAAQRQPTPSWWVFTRCGIVLALANLGVLGALAWVWAR